jgi:alpha-L-fucosidase 2
MHVQKRELLWMGIVATSIHCFQPMSAPGQDDAHLQGPERTRGAVPTALFAQSLVPADEQILPMSRESRERLGAVPHRGMCSTIPASRPTDGLLSGNGKMYVEVYGRPFDEQIIFHHERLIAPWKGDPMQAPKIAEVLHEVRRLILEGQYRKAEELALAKAEEGPTKPETSNLAEHPAFTMRIDTAGQHAVHDYLRSIDFESGEVKVRWTDDAGLWERRTFVSRPDNVIVQLLTAPANGVIHTRITLDTSNVLGESRRLQSPRVLTPKEGMPRPLINPGANEVRFVREVDEHELVLQGHYVIERGNPGYASVTRVIADGGSVHASGASLEVKGAHSLTLITRIEASNDLRQPDVEALRTAVGQLPASYEELLARHRPVQAEVMDRASLDFGDESQHSMSGEEMLADQRTRSGYNGALLSNLFDMGRYWLYLRSGDFPPIWGHVNINVNLQISGAVMENLPEAMQSYVQWTEGLLPDSRVNAQNIFGARGALFPIHPTQRGGQLDHFAYGWPHHYWISAGGWMYSPIWDYYLATGDKTFLRDHILPGLMEIGLFYEDYLTITGKDGKYIFVPSYSPENWPSNSDSSPAVINADMDIMVCREVFTHLIEASETLDVHAEAIPRWKAILAKLPPYLTDTDGALKEWAWPSLQEGVALDHRHESHMYAVWPGDEITTDQTPDLARASWLAIRKRAQGNASAHGILHRALTAARLKDATLLNFDLRELLEMGYVNASLTTLHNPYSYPAPDPQGGLPTIMMEMLVYSRPGVIGLLPALPDTLTTGRAKGIVARTQARIDDLTWDLKARTLKVTISSRIDQKVRLQVGGGIIDIEAAKGVMLSLPSADHDGVDLQLSQDRPVTLQVKIGNQERTKWVGQAKSLQ